MKRGRKPKLFAPVLSAEERVGLVAKHEAMVWKIAHKIRRRYPICELDDLVSVARLTCVYAATNFDPARGVKFITYAYRGVIRACREYAMTQVSRGVHVPKYIGFLAFPTHSCAWNGRGDGDEPPEWEPEAKRDTTPTFPPDWWERMTVHLSPDERQRVILYYRDGLTFLAIGKLLGVTRSAVQQSVARAIRLMKSVLSPHSDLVQEAVA